MTYWSEFNWKKKIYILYENQFPISKLLFDVILDFLLRFETRVFLRNNRYSMRKRRFPCTKPDISSYVNSRLDWYETLCDFDENKYRRMH